MEKKTITRFNYKDANNETHVSYHEVTSKIIAKYSSIFSGILSLISEYNNAYAAEVSVLDIIRKSEYTQEIVAQDQLRDRKYYGLTTAVKLALIDEIEGAEKIEMVLNSYGNIANRSFDKETVVIDDLIRELRDNRSTEIAKLNLVGRIDNLEAENNKFKTLMDLRYTQIAQKPTLSMRNARLAVDSLFRAILNFIDASSTVPSNSQYIEVVKELNAVSDRYKTQIAQKKSMAAKKNNTNEVK